MKDKDLLSNNGDLMVTADLKRILLKQPSNKALTKMVVFVAYPWLLHHQLDFAFAHALKERGIRVSIILCNRVQRSTRQKHGCEVLHTAANPEELCVGCQQGYGQIFHGFHHLPLESGSEAEAVIDRILPDISQLSLAEVMDVKIADIPMYRIAYSTLCTRHRAAPLDIREDWRGLLADETRIACRVWMALDQHRLYFQSEPSTTAALVFNGRFTPYRVAYYYLESLGIDRLVHERGGSDDNYSIVLNRSSTDPLFHSNPYHNSALTGLSSKQRRQCTVLATEKLLQKSIGKNTGWFSFANAASEEAQYKHGLDDSSQPMVTMFTSSPDEVDFQPHKTFIEGRQLELLAKISEKLKADGYETCIRHHPNTSKERSASGLSVANYNDEAVKYSDSFSRSIMGDENVDSMKIAQASTACIALSSSICLEIAFKTQKCIIGSSSWFKHLFPARMVIELSQESYDFPAEQINSAIKAAPMTKFEYEDFLLGVYQMYFINKYTFESFGYVHNVKLRSSPAEVLAAIPNDNILSEVVDSIISRRYP